MMRDLFAIAKFLFNFGTLVTTR